MKLETVINLCRAFEAAGLAFWIDGGWGVDALLGEQTRPHSDLDLAVDFADLPLFERTLLPLGYRRATLLDRRVWNPVLRHPTEGSLDLHGFVLNAAGDGVLGEPVENSLYPAGALEGVGRLGEIRVRCIAAPFVLGFRNGFTPRAVDRHDVDSLCRHFGLELPSRFA
jgi:lincosamide nucleotidyltransferase A/C/D/E